MRTYVTLFDRGYLVKGLLMIESLVKHASRAAQIIVLAMDETVEKGIRAWEAYATDMLRAAGQTLHLFSLADLLAADPMVANAKENRDHTEFCWTLGSVFTDFVARKWRVLDLGRPAVVTYLDADLWFFSDPELAHREIIGSIGIVRHNFAPAYRSYIGNGIFNVSWVSFDLNSLAAVQCLATWARQCLTKCSRDICGDQKYLDPWPQLYPGCVHEFKTPGMGVAPWNVSQYKIGHGPTVSGGPVVFYHYHQFSRAQDGTFTRVRGYTLRREEIEAFYLPYEREYAGTETWFKQQGIL